MHSNIAGIVRKIDPRGFGFIKANNQGDPYITKDIFFHLSNVIQITKEEMEWKDIKVGMSVMIGVVSVNNRGYEAYDVDIPVKKLKKNHNFKG